LLVLNTPVIWWEMILLLPLILVIVLGTCRKTRLNLLLLSHQNGIVSNYHQLGWYLYHPPLVTWFGIFVRPCNFENFFVGSTNAAHFPFGFCGGDQFMFFMLLLQCNRLELYYDCASRIEIISHPKERTGMFAIYQLAHTSMDDLLVSWKSATTVSQLPNTIWHRYLQILESFLVHLVTNAS
jgi:Na+-transporting methylmalonyl-CoA/oxaloacetate decarboxylase beta subunit